MTTYILPAFLTMTRTQPNGLIKESISGDFTSGDVPGTARAAPGVDNGSISFG